MAFEMLTDCNLLHFSINKIHVHEMYATNRIAQTRVGTNLYKHVHVYHMCTTRYPVGNLVNINYKLYSITNLVLS